MNKWRMAFWICLCLLITVTLFGFYSIIDQGVTITYQRKGYDDTENDLDELIYIINKTDLSRAQIVSHLEKDSTEHFYLIKEDTLYLNRISFSF